MRKGAESSTEGEMGRCPEIKGVGRKGVGRKYLPFPQGVRSGEGLSPSPQNFFLFTGVNDAFGDSING